MSSRTLWWGSRSVNKACFWRKNSNIENHTWCDQAKGNKSQLRFQTVTHLNFIWHCIRWIGLGGVYKRETWGLVRCALTLLATILLWLHPFWNSARLLLIAQSRDPNKYNPRVRVRARVCQPLIFPWRAVKFQLSQECDTILVSPLRNGFLLGAGVDGSINKIQWPEVKYGAYCVISWFFENFAIFYAEGVSRKMDSDINWRGFWYTQACSLLEGC